MTLTESLYQTMLEELTEGHLALDRLGAPREIWDGLNFRELLIAERVLALTPGSLAEWINGGCE